MSGMKEGEGGEVTMYNQCLDEDTKQNKKQ